MCRWLGYGTEKEKSAADNLLCRREFSFTTGDDVYTRYLLRERRCLQNGPVQEAAVQDRHWR